LRPGLGKRSIRASKVVGPIALKSSLFLLLIGDNSTFIGLFLHRLCSLYSYILDTDRCNASDVRFVELRAAFSPVCFASSTSFLTE
jgi:hypothetical protein